jgi:hypothetical protein
MKTNTDFRSRMLLSCLLHRLHRHALANCLIRLWVRRDGGIVAFQHAPRALDLLWYSYLTIIYFDDGNVWADTSEWALTFARRASTFASRLDVGLRL